MTQHSPTPFVLNPVDAVDLVHRASMALLARGDAADGLDDVRDAIDSILSRTVFQLREMAVVFRPEQRVHYDRLRAFLAAERAAAAQPSKGRSRRQ